MIRISLYLESGLAVSFWKKAAAAYRVLQDFTDGRTVREKTYALYTAAGMDKACFVCSSSDSDYGHELSLLSASGMRLTADKLEGQ